MPNVLIPQTHRKSGSFANRLITPPFWKKPRLSHPRLEGITGFYELNEGSPNKVFDSSPYQRHPTTITAAVASDPLGHALDFNSTSRRLVLPGSAYDYITNSDYSMVAWAYWNSGATVPNNTVGWAAYGVLADSGGLCNMGAQKDTGGADSWVFYQWDGNEDKAYGALTKGVWTLLCMCHTGGTVFCYVDGVEVAQYVSGDLNSVGSLYIGSGDDILKYLRGRMKGVRYYPYALSAQDVLSIWEDPYLEYDSFMIVPFSSGVNLVRVINESLNVSEDIATNQALLQLLNESLSLAEGLALSQAIIKSVNSTLQISEGILATKAANVIVDETLNISEGILSLVAATIVKMVNETLNVSEGVITVTGLVQILSETLNISEQHLTIKGIVAEISEALNIPEGTSLSEAQTRTVNETLSLAEGIVKAVIAVRVLNESLSLPEFVDTAKGLVQVVDEAISLLEVLITTTSQVDPAFLRGTISILEKLKAQISMDPKLKGTSGINE